MGLVTVGFGIWVRLVWVGFDSLGLGSVKIGWDGLGSGGLSSRVGLEG